MNDIVERLRNTPNWMREPFANWKDAACAYDRAPFDAADEIERLRRDMEYYRNFAAEVLTVKRLPIPQDMEAMCRRAYDNHYHKIKADMGYDRWRMVWLKAIAAHESDPQYSDGPLLERGWD